MSRQQFVFLSSRSADSYPLGEYRRDCVDFDLGTPITCGQDERILVQLASAAIPISHLTINDSNKVFRFVDTINAGTSTYTMTPAYYSTISAFVAAFNAGLLAAFPSKTISLTYTAGDYKLKVVNSSGVNVTTIKTSVSSMGALLGLGSVSDILTSTTAAYLPCFFDIGGPRAIRITAPQINLHTTDSLGNGSSLNTFASIPISVSWGLTQTYNAPFTMLLETTRKTISSIRIQLLTDNGDPYDTNGLDFACSLSVFVV